MAYIENYEYNDVVSQALDKISSYYSTDKNVKPKKVGVYRQPSSTIIELRFHKKDIKPAGIILKIRNRNDSLTVAEQEFKNLVELNKRFAKESDLHVPKVVGFIPEKRTILTEKIEGNSLYNIFVNSTGFFFNLLATKNLIYTVELAAKGLSILHVQTQGKMDKIVERDLGICQRKLKKLQETLPVDFNKGFCEKILGVLRRTAIEFKNTKLVWLHRDFTPTNMIFNRKGLYILDFTMMKIGSYFEDAARFWQALEAIKISRRFHRSIFCILQDTFLSNYKEKVDILSPEFIFYRIKDVITNLISYKILIMKDLYYSKKTYSLYYQPQIKWLKAIIESMC